MSTHWQKSWGLSYSTWQEKVFKYPYRVYEMASEILTLLLSLMFRFPNTTLGVFIGATVGFLISAIPLIGWIFAPVIKPVCIVAGGIVGFREDRDR